MTKLSEAYIHLKVDASLYELEAVQEYLSFIGNKYALELYGQELDIQVRVEEGSLKAWVTAAGIIYAGVAGYGSFRSGIDHLANDAKVFGEIVSSSFIEEAKIDKEKVYRVERRLGVPGKIKRLLTKINRLERANYTNSIVQKELGGLREEIQEIVNQIDSEKDAELFVSNLPGEFQNIQLPSPKQPLISSEVMPVIRQSVFTDYQSDGTLSDFASNVHHKSKTRHP